MWFFGSLEISPLREGGWKVEMPGIIWGDPLQPCKCSASAEDPTQAVINLFLLVRHEKIMVNGKFYRMDEANKRWIRLE